MLATPATVATGAGALATDVPIAKAEANAPRRRLRIFFRSHGLGCAVRERRRRKVARKGWLSKVKGVPRSSRGSSSAYRRRVLGSSLRASGGARGDEARSLPQPNDRGAGGPQAG